LIHIFCKFKGKLCERFEFELKGALVDSAGNVDEAFEKFKNNTPDLIITDIRMPGKDGIDLLKMLKAENVNIPVILMTGYADIEYMEAFDLGADDIFTKPVDRKALALSSTILCQDRNSWLERTIPSEIEQHVELEIEDVFGKDGSSIVSWGRSGFFLTTAIPFPSIDTFIQINLKDKSSGEITEIVGKVRFTRFDDIQGVGVQVYGISGFKSDELKAHINSLNVLPSIPKQK
jgi:CheY-like chemotaxis protein